MLSLCMKGRFCMNSNGLTAFFVHFADQSSSSFFEKPEIQELSAAIVSLAEMEGTAKKGENDFDIKSRYREVQEKLIIVLKEQNAINSNNFFNKNTLFNLLRDSLNRLNRISTSFNSNAESAVSPGFRFDSSSTNDECQLEIISKEPFSLKKTHKLKIYQKYNDIPVYGSRITLEVDESNKLLAINSLTAIADPKVLANTQKTRIHVDNIKSKIKEETQQDFQNVDLNPHLYYYYDKVKKTWRLVYITDIKYKNNELNKNNHENGFSVDVMDYIIDAYDGSIIDNIPCIKTIQKIKD